MSQMNLSIISAIIFLHYYTVGIQTHTYACQDWQGEVNVPLLDRKVKLVIYQIDRNSCSKHCAVHLVNNSLMILPLIGMLCPYRGRVSQLVTLARSLVYAV